MNSITKPILLFHLFLSVIVAVDVTCDSVNPMIQSDVACTCKTAPGTDIDWYLDDAFHSSCVLSAICVPQYSGYSFSINMTENVYMMTINSYNYSNCTKITCKDTSVGGIKQSIIPSSLVFDTNFPTSMTEPGSNHSNGIISVTTGCISGFLDVQYDWYIIVDGLEERYFVYDTNIIDTLDNSPCVNCDTDVNGQRTIGFEHSEASGSETKTGLFKVSLYHVSTNVQLNLTSRYFYTVKVRSGPTSKSWCWFDESYACIIIIIIIIFAGLAILSYLLAALIYLNQQSSKQLIKDMTFEKRRLFIPCFGLFLIIRHLCIYCKLKKDGISKELDWLKGREKQRKESLEKEKGGIKNELDMMKEQDKRRDRILMEKTELTVDDTLKMYIKQDKEFSSFIMSELQGNTAIRMEIERELLKDSTFSSHIMQDKDFLIFIERELQKNAAIYEAIEKEEINQEIKKKL